MGSFVTGVWSTSMKNWVAAAFAMSEIQLAKNTLVGLCH
jgi:hypothetical protein